MPTVTFNEVATKYSQVPQKQRFAAFGLLGVAILALYYFMVHSDLVTAQSAADEALKGAESERSEKLAYVANLALYEARLKDLNSKLDNARAMLPDTQNVPQFLAQIGGIARDVGLVIDRFEPQSELNFDFYAETRFGLQVKGSYHEIGMFLDRVSRLERLVNVSNLSMEAPKLINNRILVTGTFLLRAFRSLSSEEIKAAKEAEQKKSEKK